MSAKILNHADYQYIIDRIEDGLVSGEIRLVRGNEKIYGWWFLAGESIIVRILD